MPCAASSMPRSGAASRWRRRRPRATEAQKQIAALDVVLYFFSGIALFVGAFLILNSFNMTVLQRMREIGTLRALGATDRRVVRAVLVEALILGVVGSVLGLALGAGLAVLLIQAMKSFGMPVSTVEFSAGAAMAAVITGLVATLAGATWPALRAGRSRPCGRWIGAPAPAPRPGPPARVDRARTVRPGHGDRRHVLVRRHVDGRLGRAIGAAGATMVMMLGMVRLAPFAVLPLVRLMARPMRRRHAGRGAAGGRRRAGQPRPDRGDRGDTAGRAFGRGRQCHGRLELRRVGQERARPAVLARPDGAADRVPEYGAARRQGSRPNCARQIAAMPETAAVARRRVTVCPEAAGQ